MQTKIYPKIILTSFSIAFTLFIFSNSMYVSEQSSSQSHYVMQLINNFFHSLNINVVFSEHFIRKLAHFTEYFILGNLINLTFKAYTKKPLKFVFNILFILLIIPVTDEFLQTFIQGRSGNARDIVLDFCGAILGLFICTILFYFKEKITSK